MGVAEWLQPLFFGTAERKMTLLARPRCRPLPFRRRSRHSSPPVTICVLFCTVFRCVGQENGIVMSAQSF